MTPEGVFTYVSPKWKEFFGYELGETIGQLFVHFVHPDDVPVCVAFLRETVEEGDKKPWVEYRARCNSGAYVWYKANASLVKDDLTDAITVVGIGRDISESKRTREKLQQFNELLELRVQERTEALEKAHHRLEGILRGTNVGTWEWNVQTGEAILNERWAEIIGYTLEEISPVSVETWMKFAHPDDLKKSNTIAAKHFCGELDYYEAECRMKHRDGQWIWVLDRGKVATWTEEGKPLLMLGTHMDITKSKLAEMALQNSISRIDELSEQSGTMIWEVDAQGLFTYVNHVSESLLGYPSKEMVGRKHFYDLHPESGRSEFKASAFETFAQKQPFVNLVNAMQTKDARQVWVNTNGSPILSDDGTLMGYRGSDTNITESKKLKEQLQQAQKMGSSKKSVGKSEPI